MLTMSDNVGVAQGSFLNALSGSCLNPAMLQHSPRRSPSFHLVQLLSLI